MGNSDSGKGRFAPEDRALDTIFECTLLGDGFHKIKNALGGIGGFATLLEREISVDDPGHRLVGRIQDGVAKVNDIVITLMTLVKNPQPRLRTFNLIDVIKESLDSVWESGKAMDRDIRIENTDGSVRSEWVTDPNIFRNVVVHAMRFIDQCGGHLDRVALSGPSGRTLRLALTYTNGTKQHPREENIQEWIRSLEPIEARLSMAIVWKWVNLLGGSVVFESHSKQEKCITIELGKGNFENGPRLEKDTRPR